MLASDGTNAWRNQNNQSGLEHVVGTVILTFAWVKQVGRREQPADARVAWLVVVPEAQVEWARLPCLGGAKPLGAERAH